MKTIQHGRQTQLIKKLIILKSLHADLKKKINHG